MTNTTDETNGPVSFKPEDLDLLRRTIASDATQDEFDSFIATCKRTGLDPFSRQIYFMKHGNRSTIVTSIDGFRLLAQRSGLYGGQSAPQWCSADGQWRDVWLENQTPAAARVSVYRQDWQQPCTAVVTWKEFGANSSTWRSMPSHMLAKVAESHALRKAFSADLSGLYTADEMNAAGFKPSGQPAPEPEREDAQDPVVMAAADTVKQILDYYNVCDEDLKAGLAKRAEDMLGVEFTHESLLTLTADKAAQVLKKVQAAAASPDVGEDAA